MNRIAGPTGAQETPGVIAINTAAGNAAPLPASQTILVGTEVVLTNPAAPTAALMVKLPPNTKVDGRPLRLVATGELNNGTSSTVTLKLYKGSSTTPGSNTALGSSGAITAFAGKAPWEIIAELVFDSDSGKMNGTIKFVVNNVLVAEAAVSNVVTGITNTANPVLSFCLSVTFGTAGTQVIKTNEFGLYAA